MQPNPDCPACGGGSWQPVRAYSYTKAGDGRGDQGEHADYFALRRRVLFEVWFPGCEQAELRSLMCTRCGFMTYAPRPDANRVAAKYRFLQLHERAIGGQSAHPRAARWDRRRSDRMYRAVSRCIGRHNGARMRVLDFGGGDGKLLSSFIERGHECCLVDYNPQPRAGIQKLGDTCDDLAEGESFDVVLCSHVLEHVADPRGVIDSLALRLRHGGVLFAEVPSEIWNGIPIECDPVTHVNFFNLNNFMAVCQRSGLGVVHARQGMSTYDAGRLEVLAVVARKGHPARKVLLQAGIEETRRRLHPSRWSSLERRVRFRQLPTIGGLRHRATRLLRETLNG